MRSLVDYFEHKHSYFLDRIKIIDLFEQLIISGGIDRIPSMRMAPSEMDGLQEVADKWLQPDRDN